MKKSLFVLGMAVAAFASCTNEEVMEVAENRAIGFNTFVGNNTKAITEIDETNNKLTQMFVFGYHTTGTWTPDFENVLATGSESSWTTATTAYWQDGQDYEFAAYSDGNSATALTATFTAKSKTLSITDYTVGNKDLVAATQTVAAAQVTTPYPTVNLTFYHMLSQVKFTFTNTDSREYTMKIGNLTFKAGKTGNATFVAGTPTIDWTSTDSNQGDYTITGIDDIAEDETTTEHATESIAVMPQNTDNLEISFKATCTDAANNEIASGTFTASLDIDTNNTNSEWQPGYRYNYTAEINASTIDPNLENNEIKFTVETVDGWEDNASDIDTEPEVQQPEP